jgi:hypothetical protein
MLLVVLALATLESLPTEITGRGIPLTGSGWTDVGGAWSTGWPEPTPSSAPFPADMAVHAPANTGSGNTNHLLAQDVFLHVYTAQEYGDFEAEYSFAWPAPFVGAGFIFKATNASSFYWLDFPSEGIPSRDEYFPATLLTMTPSGWAAGMHSEWLKGVSSECCNILRTVRVRVSGATISVTIDGHPLRPITIDDGGTFAQRRGSIGFASYNQEPGIEPFGTRYSNLSVTSLQASSPGQQVSMPRWGGGTTVPRAWGGIDPKVAFNKEGTGPVARDPASGAIVWCCAQPGILANSTTNGRSWGQGANVKGTSIVSGASLRGKTATNNLRQLEAYVWRSNSIGDGGGIALLKSEPLGANRYRVVANVTAASLGRALCSGAAANLNPPPARGRTPMQRCLALANSSFLSDWVAGGGGTPFLEMPDGTLLFMVSFSPPSSISHLNGRAYWYWGPFLEGAMRSTDGGESFAGPFNVDGRPRRSATGGYGDNEDNKGGFAPMPMFTLDGNVVTIGNGGPGARNWESWSSDGGITWTGQARGSFYTTAAASCTTTSGVLIAAGRSPGGVTLHASFDGGRR